MLIFLNIQIFQPSSICFVKKRISHRNHGCLHEEHGITPKTIQKAVRDQISISKKVAAEELKLDLKARAKRNGTVDLDSVESRFVLDENGVCIDVHRSC